MRLSKCSVPNCQVNMPPRHRFPNPKKDLARLNEWRRLIQNPALEKLSPEELYEKKVCRRHFESKYFSPFANRLHLNALPSLYLPSSSTESAPEVVEDKRNAEDTIVDPSDLQSVDKDKLKQNSNSCEENLNINLNKESITNVQLDGVVSPACDSERVLDKPLNLEGSTQTEKPYFKSLKSLLQGSNIVTEVCRICFESLQNEEVINLYEESSQEDTSQIKKLIKFVLPNLDLDMYVNSVICVKCAELLVYSFQLKEKWLSTEEKLQKIIKDRKGVINSDSVLLIMGKQVENIKNKSVSQMDHNYYREPPSLESENKVSISHHKPKGSDSVSSKQTKRGGITRKKTKPIMGLGPYMCEQCGRTYLNVKTFNAHLRLHKDRKTLKRECTIMCEICGQLFKTVNGLVNHKKKHSENKCTVCDRIFDSKKNLHCHIAAKHLDKSFQCHFCGKQFPYRTSLNMHLRIHNPDSKDKACHICDKKFILNSMLKRHLRCHTQEKLLKCDYCGKFLKYGACLKKHIQIYHLNQAKHVCEFCNKPYWKKCDLAKHRLRLHWDVLPGPESNEVPNEENSAVDSH